MSDSGSFGPLVCLSTMCSFFKAILLWASTCDFQQCGISTSVDSDEPVQPPFKLRNSKWYSVSSLTLIEYSSDWQRLWSDCAYVQADLRLCWSHIPHCWKSHVVADLYFTGDHLHCNPLNRPYKSHVLAYYPDSLSWNPFDKDAVGMVRIYTK